MSEHLIWSLGLFYVGLTQAVRATVTQPTEALLTEAISRTTNYILNVIFFVVMGCYCDVREGNN
ncbi:hypothetical protein [Nostoc sp.]|uniref:hypothetical protein n=1 Tax=Nostoc sp. TaxID=1180 RepID=UPI002FF6759C